MADIAIHLNTVKILGHNSYAAIFYNFLSVHDRHVKNTPINAAIHYPLYQSLNVIISTKIIKVMCFHNYQTAE